MVFAFFRVIHFHDKMQNSRKGFRITKENFCIFSQKFSFAGSWNPSKSKNSPKKNALATPATPLPLISKPWCLDISLIKMNVNRPLNQFLVTETEFIVYSRINSLIYLFKVRIVRLTTVSLKPLFKQKQWKYSRVSRQELLVSTCWFSVKMIYWVLYKWKERQFSKFNHLSDNHRLHLFYSC